MGLKSSATDEEIVQYCLENLHRDGDVEFDSTSPDDGVSRGTDHGVYVQAWVWVDFDHEDCDECGMPMSEDNVGCISEEHAKQMRAREATADTDPDEGSADTGRVFNARGICVEEWGPNGKKDLR